MTDFVSEKKVQTNIVINIVNLFEVLDVKKIVKNVFRIGIVTVTKKDFNGTLFVNNKEEVTLLEIETLV